MKTYVRSGVIPQNRASLNRGSVRIRVALERVVPMFVLGLASLNSVGVMFIVKRQINHLKLRRSDMYLWRIRICQIYRNYDGKYVFDWIEYGKKS